MKRFIVIALMIGAFCLGASAQEKFKVEIKGDSKFINVDELGLPGTTAMSEVLRMLPELLNRPTLTMLDNYDIQINGFSVGDSKEQILSQTYLSDVITIEIDEDAVASYQNNGQGGTIDFTLRPLKEGVSGKVNLDAYTLFELQPTLQFNFKKKKFSLYSYAAYDMYLPGTSFENTMKVSPQLISSSDTTTTKSHHQMFRTFMEYKPSEKDVLTLQLFETFGKKNDDYSHVVEGSYIINNSTQQGKSLNLSANLKYVHTFKSASLTAEARYGFNQSNNGMTFGSNRSYDIEDLTEAVSGKLEYVQNFTPKGKMKSGSIGFGTNFNFPHIGNDRNESFFPGLDQPITTQLFMVGDCKFISPYFKTEWVLGKWRLKLTTEYQIYNYSLIDKYIGDGNSFEKSQHDFTGKFVAGWQLAPHHHLRLIVDRKIRRPSNFQVYPFKLYDVSKRYYFKGNSDLNPERSHEYQLDYITDIATKHGDFLMVNVNASYIHVNGVIGTSAASFDPEFCYDYKTFINDGTNSIFRASAMLLYSVGRLSVSLSGNVFNNNTVIGGVADHYTYYSLAILPSLAFDNHWSLTASAMYSSPVKTINSELGQSAFAHLRLSKSWGNVIASIQGMLPLSAKATDLYFDEDDIFSVRRYMPYKGYLGISCSWQF